ncbi:MAG: cytochrome c3 family protein [Magnetococcales bacterium]|nr:cytochrome c3 family protein [Magnetococcales bacterium]
MNVRLPVLILLAGLTWAVGAVDRMERVHPDMACSECHVAGSRTVAGTARMLLADWKGLCEKCHPDAVRQSHPSGFRPGRVLPAEYPLDWKGEMTCGSCHRVHETGEASLRGEERGRAFCSACHDEGFFRRMREGGDSLQGLAHLEKGIGDFHNLPLDGPSLLCLECHVDNLNLSVEGSRVSVTHREGAGGHPVGSPYGVVRSGYRNVEQIPREVQMPDGRVSCVSCHQGYSRKHGALVISNQGSSLCLACHDL